MKKRIHYRVDFDGNIAEGCLGETVTSTMGDTVRFIKFWSTQDHKNRPVDKLLIRINGAPACDTLSNGMFWQGRFVQDFERFTPL